MQIYTISNNDKWMKIEKPLKVEKKKNSEKIKLGLLINIPKLRYHQK